MAEPSDGKLKRKKYEKELRKLQIELVRLQEWVKHKGRRVIIVFEGRDGAGKGGTIRALTERVSPRVFRVVALPAQVRERLDRQEFHLALEAVMASVREANGYITLEAPWALKKTDPVRMAVVLRHLHTALRCYATLLQPFMPETAGRMLDQLGVPASARDIAALGTALPAGTALPPPAPLFRKIELPAA